MTFTLRPATNSDVPALLPRSRALQDHEGIEISDVALEQAMREMLANPNLGCVFVIDDDGRDVGYAFLSFSFDLEFGGREAWLTELFIDDAVRGRGAGAFTLAAIEPELRARGVHASASSSVDLPAPFSPTKKVTRGSISSLPRVAIAGIEYG